MENRFNNEWKIWNRSKVKTRFLWKKGFKRLQDVLETFPIRQRNAQKTFPKWKNCKKNFEFFGQGPFQITTKLIKSPLWKSKKRQKPKKKNSSHLVWWTKPHLNVILKRPPSIEQHWVAQRYQNQSLQVIHLLSFTDCGDAPNWHACDRRLLCQLSWSILLCETKVYQCSFGD